MADTNTTSTALFKEGNAPFIFDGLELQTYYTVAGDLKSSKQTPLVLVHGGPGFDGQYLVTHGDLIVKYEIPVIIFDQIGCGKSTHLTDIPRDFWNLELFSEQIEQLLVHLSIKDGFNLLGHSWGGLLSAYFAGTRKLLGLRHLILVGSPASIPLVNLSFNQCLDKFPERLRIVARNARDGEEYNPDDLKEARALFIKRHRCKLEPFPESLKNTYKDSEKDRTVLRCMTGPAPFKLTGTLENVSIIDKLPNITTPTLLVRGVDDMIGDICMQPFFDRIAKVKWFIFPESTHIPFSEEREKYMELLNSFTAL